MCAFGVLICVSSYLKIAITDGEPTPTGLPNSDFRLATSNIETGASTESCCAVVSANEGSDCASFMSLHGLASDECGWTAR